MQTSISSRDYSKIPKSNELMFKVDSGLLFKVSGFFLILGLALSIFGLYQYQTRSQFRSPEINIFLASVDSQYLSTLNHEVIAPKEILQSRSKQLLAVDYILPNIKISQPYLSLIAKLETCHETISGRPSDRQVEKLVNWYDHLCNGKSVDEGLWLTEPYNHPMGGSWAHWVWKHKQYPQSWVDQNKAYFHVLELSELDEKGLSDLEKQISSLHVDTWAAMIGKVNNIISPTHFFVKTEAEWGEVNYKRYSIDEVKSAMYYAPFTIGDMKSSLCVRPFGQFCWLKNAIYTPESFTNWLYLAVLGLFIIVMTILNFFFRLRAQYDSQRELMVHTLAHELRHPATSINLSLEFFRDQIDRLDEGLQVEVLRMIDEVKRLKLLVRASEQYLVTDSSQKMKLKPVRVKSVNAYLGRIANSYNVDFVGLKVDSEFICDAYWLGVCIENLIKNGLRHGKKPVTLRAEMMGAGLEIAVTDAGEGISGDFRGRLNAFTKDKKSGGIGLGLAITKKVVDLMGAKLSYQKHPSTFTITLNQSEVASAEDSVA